MRSRRQDFSLRHRLAPAALLALAGTLFLLVAPGVGSAQTLPVFVDGLAQIVPGFSDSSAWIRHRLWVETEFDSDGDSKLDRMHVDVTRPAQTDTEA